ncbi:TonB-dependent receptor [Aliiglaciecola sp. SL4]|uniref:TonB-dependent receptor n=1 Tax=Aliiglaciecola sp. SL4 TaxID=3239806 RepID=UPI00355C7DBA
MTAVQHAAVKEKFTRNAITLALSALLPMGAAHAQDVQELAVSQATSQTEEDYKVENSTSVKYTQPLLNTAKSITVIPQSVMKDRNVDSLRSALRNVPGISMAAGEGGTPTGDSMSIRGFSAANNILIDGVRDIAGYSRDIYNVEAVEVAKGPGAAIYGRGAAGGAVNLQIKTATLDEFTDVSLRLGTENDYRAQVDTNLTLGDTSALRINALLDDGDVAGRNYVNNSNNAVALSFATGLGTESRISVNADYQKQDNLPDYGMPWVSNSSTSDPVAELAAYEGGPSNADFDNFYGNIYRDFEDIKGQSLTAKYEYDLNNSTMLRALVRTGSIERQSVVTAPRFISVTTSTDVRLSDEKTRDTKDSMTVFQGDLIGSYQQGNIKHDIAAGVELSREKFERWNFEAIVPDNLNDTPELVDLYNPDAEVAFTGQYARTDKSNEATGDTKAIYVFDTITLDPQWQLSLGLRWDSFETEYFYDLDGDDPSVKLNAKNDELSWNAGIVYKPDASSSIYFGAGNSFSPTAEDLTASSNSNSNQNNLDPEETLSYELGYKWEIYDGKLFANAAIFRSEKTNALTDDPFFDDEQRNYDTLNGKQRVDGIELGLAGNLSDKLSIIAAYTFQDSEVVNAEGADASQIGAELPRTPEHSYSVWGRYDYSDALAFGLGAQYMGKRYNSSTPASREVADSYMIWDMMISYQATEQLSLQVNGSNLTDEDYVDQIGGGHYIPGEGRYLSVTANYQF